MDAANSLVILTVNGLCKLFLKYGLRLKTINLKAAQQTIQSRSSPLITVSNHTSTMDDPLLFALFSNFRITKSDTRWAIGAREICFTNPLLSWFFSAGKVLPIDRGGGIHQESMNILINKLNTEKRAWIHIFPEGRVIQSSTSRIGKFKWGIGRLVMDSKVPPIIQPFWHHGMQRIMKEKRKILLPVLNQELVVVFGEKIDSKVLLEYCLSKEMSEEETRIYLTKYIRDAIVRIRVDNLHLIEKHKLDRNKTC